MERNIKHDTHKLQQFYCPACPTTPLRIGADPVAKCGVCGWTSRKVEGLNKVSDLFALDAEPWPDVVGALQESVSRWKRRIEEANKKCTRSEIHGRFLGNSMSLSNVNSEVERMRRLLSAKQQDTVPPKNVNKYWRIPVDMVILAPNIYSLEQVPPRRNLKSEFQVIAPALNKIVQNAVLDNPQRRDNSATFLPSITAAAVDHNCITGYHTAAVWIELSNYMKTDVKVFIQDRSILLELGPKERKHMRIVTRAKRVRHGETGRCPCVIPLKFTVQMFGNSWVYYVFVWHHRGTLPSDREQKVREVLEFDISGENNS